MIGLILQDESFPDQLIDWDAAIAIESLVVNTSCDSRRETYQFLVKCSFIERINTIGLKQWRDNVINMVMGPKFTMPYDVKEGNWLDDIRSKLILYEAEYHRLKEATSLLELVLWRNEIGKSKSDDGRKSRKRKFEEPDSRSQCRVSCGADIIIRNVLPYLVPVSGN